MTDEDTVTRVHFEGGTYVRVSETQEQVADLLAHADNGWSVAADPGTGDEVYLAADKVLYLSLER